MTAFEPRISLITLGVSDMARSRAFYEALGWKVAAPSNDSVTFFQGRGIVLGLFGHDALAEDAGVEIAPMPDFRGVSLAYNCRSEAEVDQAFEHAKACGAKPLKPPQKVFWGGYSGYFADPDGHLWEVAHNPFAPLDGEGHMRVDGPADGEDGG
ncbi:MAG: VOC family protein [Nitratireductor sp.]|nr:VOC family protein [Nitratireductor sp.]